MLLAILKSKHFWVKFSQKIEKFLKNFFFENYLPYMVHKCIRVRMKIDVYNVL